MGYRGEDVSRTLDLARVRQRGFVGRRGTGLRQRGLRRLRLGRHGTRLPARRRLRRLPAAGAGAVPPSTTPTGSNRPTGRPPGTSSRPGYDAAGRIRLSAAGRARRRVRPGRLRPAGPSPAARAGLRPARRRPGLPGAERRLRPAWRLPGAPRGSGSYPALPDGADGYQGRDAGNDWYGGQPAAASGASFADTGTYALNGRIIEEYGTGPNETLRNPVRGYPPTPGQPQDPADDYDHYAGDGGEQYPDRGRPRVDRRVPDHGAQPDRRLPGGGRNPTGEFPTTERNPTGGYPLQAATRPASTRPPCATPPAATRSRAATQPASTRPPCATPPAATRRPPQSHRRYPTTVGNPTGGYPAATGDFDAYAPARRGTTAGSTTASTTTWPSGTAPPLTTTPTRTGTAGAGPAPARAAGPRPRRAPPRRAPLVGPARAHRAADAREPCGWPSAPSSSSRWPAPPPISWCSSRTQARRTRMPQDGCPPRAPRPRVSRACSSTEPTAISSSAPLTRPR